MGGFSAQHEQPPGDAAGMNFRNPPPPQLLSERLTQPSWDARP